MFGRGAKAGGPVRSTDARRAVRARRRRAERAAREDARAAARLARQEERAARKEARSAESALARARAEAAAGSSLPALTSLRGRSRAAGVLAAAGFLVAVVGASAGAVVTAALATPQLGGEWLAGPLAGGVSGVAALLAAAWMLRGAISRRVRTAAAVWLLVLPVMWGWGASTQVVIDGRPYLQTSETAQAWQLTRELLDDMYTLSEYDTLLGYDATAARSNLLRYEPAAEEMAEISARWSNFEVSGAPDPRFIPIMRHVATSADFGSQAMRRRYELALQYNSRTEAEAASYRETYIRELLVAGPLLAEIGDHYGFELPARQEVASS